MPKRSKKDSPLTSTLKESGVRSPQDWEPLWKGPEVDGITQSLLGRFIVCRERFRLLVVEGLKPRDKFNHRLEFGNMWHLCEETFDAKGDWEKALRKYSEELCEAHVHSQVDVLKWYNIAKRLFPIYLDYWKDSDYQNNYTSLLQEEVFEVDYKLPSGRVVLLKGKWDSLDLTKVKSRTRLVYVRDHKTKGDIDDLHILRQLEYDLQTMFYLTAIYSSKDKYLGDNAKYPIGGMIYNLVKRPLSSGKGSIKPLKAKGDRPAEKMSDYYDRVVSYAIEEPDRYFKRLEVDITEENVRHFEQTFLIPILETLWDWWEWVSSNPRDPWVEGNNIHYRTPFGIYNVLAEGGQTELDGYLATGSLLGLTHTDTLFPEL